MVMTLDETITRLRIIASFRGAKKQNKEEEETLQLMNWLIELKSFKEEEKKKLDLLNEIIENKNMEIENQEIRIEKLEDELEMLKSNKI
ncbi:hypothetical protein P5F25_02515 [Clostridium perfringens]|nr:hypothetical protein [Clostridium perfringens]